MAYLSIYFARFAFFAASWVSTFSSSSALLFLLFFDFPITKNSTLTPGASAMRHAMSTAGILCRAIPVEMLLSEKPARYASSLRRRASLCLHSTCRRCLEACRLCGSPFCRWKTRFSALPNILAFRSLLSRLRRQLGKPCTKSVRQFLRFWTEGEDKKPRASVYWHCVYGVEKTKRQEVSSKKLGGFDRKARNFSTNSLWTFHWKPRNFLTKSS